MFGTRLGASKYKIYTHDDDDNGDGDGDGKGDGDGDGDGDGGFRMVVYTLFRAAIFFGSKSRLRNLIRVSFPSSSSECHK